MLSRTGLERFDINERTIVPTNENPPIGMSTAPSCATINLASGGGLPSYFATTRLFNLEDKSIYVKLSISGVVLV